MDYEIGDIVVYGPFAGEDRVVLVDTKEDDIKNGRPGFAGVVQGGASAHLSVWGYDDQITRIVRF